MKRLSGPSVASIHTLPKEPRHHRPAKGRWMLYKNSFLMRKGNNNLWSYGSLKYPGGGCQNKRFVHQKGCKRRGYYGFGQEEGLSSFRNKKAEKKALSKSGVRDWGPSERLTLGILGKEFNVTRSPL